ncbi:MULTISPECIES: patatin-like phospholipase family protein [unclassified Paraflavitalea]|uniref:patatin-like phospholipase family protein n=1 Tax=unclassified Paraflavitalea TaxID=2798305 RepID=UPI003D33259C
MKQFLFAALLLFSFEAMGQRPKIGLTLSGGGAKGLAHIGILKAIDSAGLKIDYITGTSMGSIVGALYASGYSADQLEQIAKRLDWELLLTNASSLRAQVMEEKSEYGKYGVELPWINNRFRLPSGVLESEELWLKFSELFFHVYQIKDFSKLPIPFKCIAADVATGEAVVLDKGDIVTAIRSSMAIPTVFTAVENNGKKLVDGGVVRNFPVKDVREMGADYVIGSNVSTGLLPKERVNNALQVLLQIAFFKEAEDLKIQIKDCDLYLPLPIENYNTASFNKSDEILRLGIEEGRRLYPIFKHLADSINAQYGETEQSKIIRPSFTDSVKLTSIEIHGLERTTPAFFAHMVGYYDNRYYTAAKLNNMIRKAFGTRYYNKITYTLYPDENHGARIIFDVIENPETFAKIGLHYNKFTGISVLANITSRNFFTASSRSYLTLNFGERFRLKGEHLQYLGRGKNVAAIADIQFENLIFPAYTNFKKTGEYKNYYTQSNLKIQYSRNRSYTVGTGIRYESTELQPSIETAIQFNGDNHFFTHFLYWNVNTLDRPTLPKKGLKLETELGYIFNQRADVTITQNGIPLNKDSLGISFNNYQRLMANFELYTPLGKRSVFSLMFQGGVNFNYAQNIFNDFVIGGMVRTFRNQIVFVGLEEGSFFTPSVGALQAGLRVNANTNLYFAARTNALVNNFISQNNLLQKPEFLSGHALSVGYNTALGPLELSFQFNDQSSKFSSYINFGINF